MFSYLFYVNIFLIIHSGIGEVWHFKTATCNIQHAQTSAFILLFLKPFAWQILFKTHKEMFCNPVYCLTGSANFSANLMHLFETQSHGEIINNVIYQSLPHIDILHLFCIDIYVHSQILQESVFKYSLTER